jgi:ABC-2 type transport system ATP-binding protein
LVEEAVVTDSLTKNYRAVTAVADLSMTVPKGEIFGFLGPNGAGKTTAVKLLLGLASPTSGQARVLGKPAGNRAARARIGYLPELFRYQGWLTAHEVLSLHCGLAGMAAGRVRAEVEKALVTVGLAERAHHRVATFSKGMQQRLGLGVAMLGSPELIFLDEPTSALDPVGRRDVRNIIRGLKDAGTTVFLNSHMLAEVEQVCERVAVMERGRVVATGTLKELTGGSGVKIRMTGLKGPTGDLAKWGSVTVEGDWLTVAEIEPGAVPGLVADLVGRGAEIHAVIPGRRSLEDSFIDLLGDR